MNRIFSQGHAAEDQRAEEMLTGRYEEGTDKSPERFFFLKRVRHSHLQITVKHSGDCSGSLSWYA